MTVYSYAQLEGLWINAGGSKSLAPVMAAIAEAESGGNSDAHNPSGASGLWQILGNPFPGNPFDPATNARMAVAKYKSQGLGAWVTYTSGAYKAYLSGKTTPDSNVPGSPSGVAAQVAASGSVDCLVQNPLAISVPLIGSLSAGPSCLFSMSNARAFIGAGLIALSVPIGMAALAVAAVAVGQSVGVLPGASRYAQRVPAVQAISNIGQQTGRATTRAARQRAPAAPEDDDAALEKLLGQPKENPDLEVRGGTVRESGEQRAARERRQRAAARARTRRAISPGGQPATREEAGF